MPQFGVEADHVGRDVVTFDIRMCTLTLLRSEPEPRPGAPSQPRSHVSPPDGSLRDTYIPGAEASSLLFISRSSMARAGAGGLHRSTSTRTLRDRPPIDGTPCAHRPPARRPSSWLLTASNRVHTTPVHYPSRATSTAGDPSEPFGRSLALRAGADRLARVRQQWRSRSRRVRVASQTLGTPHASLSLAAPHRGRCPPSPEIRSRRWERTCRRGWNHRLQL